MKFFSKKETTEMSLMRLTVEIGKHVKKLEELGMEHKEACSFVSNIMNLGIASDKIPVKRITKVKSQK